MKQTDRGQTEILRLFRNETDNATKRQKDKQRFSFQSHAFMRVAHVQTCDLDVSFFQRYDSPGKLTQIQMQRQMVQIQMV